jgi:uncharacterized protein YbaA (DUF1428 family)
MPRYVDGFVIPLPKKKLRFYKNVARKAGKIWMEFGALEYRECIGDDLNIKGMASFPRIARAKKGETVVFSWIVYKSKADRNRINAKIMNDPRILAMMDPKDMPFDVKRMAMGGFKVLVEY